MMVLSILTLLWLCQYNLVQAKHLWSSQYANYTDLIRNAYPLGNGQLAVLPFGEPGNEKFNVNKDSLWSGGPFENGSYTGANPSRPLSPALPGIIDWIFQNGTGNTSALQTDSPNYGNYFVLGNLSISMPSLLNKTSKYRRSLDINTGVHTANFTAGGNKYSTQIFCSYPSNVCIYELSSNTTLPALSLNFENVLSNSSLVNSSCSTSQQSALFSGTTAPEIGMIYKAQARLIGTHNTTCQDGVLNVKPQGRSIAFVVAAGTNNDENKGTRATNFSFRGTDPEPAVANTTSQASSKTVTELLRAHIEDFQPYMDRFSLDLPDTQNSSQAETAPLYDGYGNDTDTISHNDPYLESLQFDYGRYLFISSSRPGSLPPNLQGKWAYGITNAWSADYHTDINLQMNHWGVDQTGFGDLQEPLWTYMTKTWIPRGTESARLIYNASGWVVQSYVNPFGATGMNSGPDKWTDYPAAPAWLMLHVADHFAYSQDKEWLIETGYPLLKGVAEFWLSQLQPDGYFKDGTLVAVPCDSPEHGPTTFGCTHYQQLIHSLFVNTLNAAATVQEPDQSFVKSLKTALTTLDTGVHIGSFSQIQEWKLDLDTPNDTHRHLSNLIGWYPGHSISGLLSGYTNYTIQSAVATTLWSRGPGIADDNAGWEKVWRAACWARLNETERAYYELRLTMQQNFAMNGLSMYSGRNEPFQIDANFGYLGAVLGMLVVDLPGEQGREGEVRRVVLGPAIPREWAGGSVRGLRIRGGGVVDFGWDGEGVVDWVHVRKEVEGVAFVNQEGKLLG